MSLTGTTAVNFGSQPIGTPSPAQTAAVTNNGNSTLHVLGIAATGDFAQTNNCGLMLGPGANCSVSITFTPTLPGSRTGALTANDDAGGGPHSFSLVGIGTGPFATLSVTALTFSNQRVGTTSAAHSVTLTNSGNATLNISTLTASGDFNQGNNCPLHLGAGASCTITVTFAPTVRGSRTGTLTITDNAAGSPHTVALAGTGTDFTLAAAAGGSTSATVAADGTATYNLTLAPTGFAGTVSLACSGAPARATCTASPTSLVLDGANPAAFSVSVRTTARSIAPPEVGAPRAPLEQFGGPRWDRGGLRAPLQPGTGRHTGLPLQVWLMALATLVMIAALRQRGRVTLRLRSASRATSRGIDPPLQLRGALLAFAGMLLMVVMWAACGGGGGGGGGGGNPGTPPGTYSLTVTATSSGVSHSMALTLRVN